MARPIGGTPSYSGVPEQSVDCGGALSEASNIPKKEALISSASFLLLVLLLRFYALVPYIYAPCKRPRKNQRRTKERPKNSESGNVRFIKTYRFPKNLSPLLKRLTKVLKQLTHERRNMCYQSDKMHSNERFYLHNSKKSCIFATKL